MWQQRPYPAVLRSIGARHFLDASTWLARNNRLCAGTKDVPATTTWPSMQLMQPAHVSHLHIAPICVYVYLQKELKEIDSDKASGVTAEVVADNLQHLIGSVPGPKDTPYEGGLFRVDIQLDAQYPFAPPKMRFMTRVWHPNVSSANGAICLGEAAAGGGWVSFGHCGEQGAGLAGLVGAVQGGVLASGRLLL